MNMFNNNRSVFWILIFLVMINITALATILIYSRKTAIQPAPASGPKQGIALKQELSLTPDQSLKVNKINAAYQATSEPVIEAIRQMKANLLVELSKVDTDTNQLAKIAGEITDQQKNLQQVNIKQFLELKQVCNPEQTQKLSQIYAGLYGCNQQGAGNGRGNGNGMRYRHRHGQQQTDSTRIH